MEYIRETVWSLVGAFEHTNAAENSGLLLLTTNNNIISYIIADGNDIKIKEDKFSISTIPDRYISQSKKTDIPYKTEYAAALYITIKENIHCEFIDFISDEPQTFKEFKTIINVAGKYIAIYNPNHLNNYDLYMIVKTTDNKIINTYQDAGSAYEDMRYLNLKEREF